MSKEALVEVNVSDTDELRITKVNRNFQLLFKKSFPHGTTSSQGFKSPVSLASSQDGVTREELGEYIKTDEAYQEFSTQEDIDDAIAELKADLTWITESPAFSSAVSTIIDQSISGELEENGAIATAIKDAIDAACSDGGSVFTLVEDKVAKAIEECKKYTDEQIANLGSVANLSIAEEKESNGIVTSSSVAEHSIGADLGNRGMDSQEASGSIEEIRNIGGESTQPNQESDS